MTSSPSLPASPDRGSPRGRALSLILPAAVSAALYAGAVFIDLDGTPVVTVYARVFSALSGYAPIDSSCTDFMTKAGGITALTTECLYLDLSACALPWLLLAPGNVLKGSGLYGLFLLAAQAANFFRLAGTLWLLDRGAAWFLAHDLVDTIIWYSFFCAAVLVFLKCRRLALGRWLIAFAVLGSAWDLSRALLGGPG